MIPLVDLSSSDGALGAQLSKAIHELGFITLKSPGTPLTAQVEELFEISRRFFEEEPRKNKEGVGITIDNKGWVKVRQEVLDTENNPTGDVKEAFNLANFGVDGAPRQPLPPLLEQHTRELGTFMKSCHRLGMTLLEAFAQDMGLESDFFTSKHRYEEENGSILRLLYYPPSSKVETARPQDIRAGAHSDYGTLTLLFQKEVGGLQILLPESPSDTGPKWLDAPVIDDAVLVNVGDSFDFWTGGKFKSTQHRVVSPRTADESVARFSIVYFLHPTDSELLSRIQPTSLEGAQPSENDKRSVIRRFGVSPDAQLTAKEWLLRRLESSYSSRKGDNE